MVDDDSDVGVIFETLNQRGKELTELEKTKNYLLYLTSLLDDGPRQRLAATINECWRTIFVNLGSAQLGPSHEDQLLRAHWLATQDPRQREWEKIRSVKKRFHRNLGSAANRVSGPRSGVNPQVSGLWTAGNRLNA